MEKIALIVLNFQTTVIYGRATVVFGLQLGHTLTVDNRVLGYAFILTPK